MQAEVKRLNDLIYYFKEMEAYCHAELQLERAKQGRPKDVTMEQWDKFFSHYGYQVSMKSFKDRDR